MFRWNVNIKTRNGNEYLMQLEGLGAVLVFPADSKACKIVDLSRRPFRLEDRDTSSIQRVFFTDANQNSVESLVKAMGLNIHPTLFMVILPFQLEEDMHRKELAYKGLKDDEIQMTTFQVLNVGGKYVLEVADQTRK